MKRMLKIFGVLCLAAVLITGIVFTAMAVDGAVEYTGNVEELTALVDTYEATADADAKLEAFSGVAAYLTNTPVDPASEGYDAVMARVYTAYFSTVGAKVEVIGAAADGVEAYAAVEEADRIWNMIAVPEGTEGLAELAAEYDEAVIATAQMLLSEIDPDIKTTLNTAANQAAVNRLNSLLKRFVLKVTDENEAYAELYEELEVLVAAHNAAVKANFDALDGKNPLKDYEDGVIFENTDFDSLAVSSLADGAVGSTILNTTHNGTTHPMGVGEEENGNKYLYNKYTTGGNSYYYVQLNKCPTANGYVFEWDMTTFDKLPSTGVKMEPGGIGPSGNRKFPPCFVMVTGSGDVQYQVDNSSGAYRTVLKNAIVPGEWIHMMVIFDPIEFTYSIYVQGEHLSTSSGKINGQIYDHYAENCHFRFGTNTNNGSFAIDNFRMYGSTNYRDIDKFTNMSNEEKFLFYTDFVADESKDAASRKIAYDQVSDTLSKYYEASTGFKYDEYTDPETGELTELGAKLESAVNTYLNFDYDAFLLELAVVNRDEFGRLVDELAEYERTGDNIPDRQAKLNKIVDFLVENAGNIKDDDQTYQDIKFKYDRLLVDINTDVAILSFNRAMSRFLLVESLVGRQKYVNQARELVQDASYPITEALYLEYKYEYDEHGEIATDENGDPILSDRFVAFVEAYDTYIEAQKIVEAMERDAESEKIVVCVDYIDEFAGDEEAYLANYNYINRYILILRETVRANNYNPDYEGLDEALETLAPMEKWFYDYLQNQHITVLKEKLDIIVNTESYVEKMGQCSFIERYLNTNDIDRSYVNEAGSISLLINAYETQQKELEFREADYAELLVQNAHYFNAMIDTMVLARDYTTKREQFDRAYDLYFSIDAAVEGTADRIAIFDEYITYFEMIDGASQNFIAAVAMLEKAVAEGAGADEIFELLVECYLYSEDAELSIDGVADAMAVFSEAANEYMAELGTVNGEVESFIQMVGAVRANSGISPIISVVLKLMLG